MENIASEAINDGQEQNGQPFQKGPNGCDDINTVE